MRVSRKCDNESTVRNEGISGMKRVIVFLADGFEEIEALSPVDYLRRAGAEVLILSLNASSRNVCGAHKINVQADMLLDSYVSSQRE